MVVQAEEAVEQVGANLPIRVVFMVAVFSHWTLYFQQQRRQNIVNFRQR